MWTTLPDLDFKNILRIIFLYGRPQKNQIILGNNRNKIISKIKEPAYKRGKAMENRKVSSFFSLPCFFILCPHPTKSPIVTLGYVFFFRSPLLTFPRSLSPFSPPLFTTLFLFSNFLVVFSILPSSSPLLHNFVTLGLASLVENQFFFLSCFDFSMEFYILQRMQK